MAAKIRKGDKVVVLAGRDKGKSGEVTLVFPTERRAVVAGVNVVKRHTRQSAKSEGGILSKEAPIDLSNLAIADPKTGKPTRVGFKTSRRRPQGPLRQAFRRPDRWLRQNRTRAASRRRPTSPPRRPARRRRRRGQGRRGEGRQGRSQGRQGRGQGRQGQEAGAAEAAKHGQPKAPPKDYAARLKALYDKEIVPKLVKEFGYKNALQVPKIDKIVLNMGVGEAVNDTKKVTAAAADLALIAGQKPIVTRARKAISTFKVRENMPIGAKVTLRKTRMYEFLDRLVTVALPRVRDFRGLDPKSFDGRGNYALGDQGAHRVPRDRLRQGGGDAGSRHRRLHDRQEPTTRRALCCAPSTSRSGSERRKRSDAENGGRLNGKEECNRE